MEPKVPAETMARGRAAWLHLKYNSLAGGTKTAFSWSVTGCSSDVHQRLPPVTRQRKIRRNEAADSHAENYIAHGGLALPHFARNRRRVEGSRRVAGDGGIGDRRGNYARGGDAAFEQYMDV